MSITFVKRFASSYYVKENDDVCVQSLAQYTAIDAVDQDGNKWVAFSHADFNSDLTARFKTKKQAVQYVIDNAEAFNL